MAHKASETGVREKTWVRERKLPSLLRTLLWNIEQCAREFDCELCPVNKRCLSLWDGAVVWCKTREDLDHYLKRFEKLRKRCQKDFPDLDILDKIII